MAIALIMKFENDGRDVLGLYDQANAAMHTVDTPPEGLVMHWAAKTESGGLCVVDVWASREQFDRFFAQKLGPTAQQLGLPQPNIEEFSVYNVIDGRVPSAT